MIPGKAAGFSPKWGKLPNVTAFLAPLLVVTCFSGRACSHGPDLGVPQNASTGTDGGPSTVPRHQHLVVCYIRGSAVSRLGDTFFDFGTRAPNHTYPKICTHLVYSHAEVDEETGEVKPADPGSELGDRGLYSKIKKLKELNRNLKILISIGGPETTSTSVVADVGSEDALSTWSQKLRTIISSADKRKKFGQSVISFLQNHGFDGLDINFHSADFNSPAVKVEETFDEDGPNDLESFMKELKNELAGQSSLLTAAVPFDLAQNRRSLLDVARNVDHLAIKAYDYHDVANGTTGHGAPHPQVVESALKFLEMGVPREKIVLGTKFYATAYHLATKSRKSGAGASSSGLFSREDSCSSCRPGSLTYQQVCTFINDGTHWRQKWDSQQESFYLIDSAGTKWISYENEETLHYKVRFIQKQNLAGIMVWSVDGDDVTGTCGGGRVPLLNAVQLALKTPPGGGIYGR